MNCSRQDWHRALDFSAVRNADTALAAAIISMLRRRKAAQREKEIARWFRGTPKAFVSATLGDMLAAGTVKAGRTSLSRNRCVLEYYITDDKDSAPDFTPSCIDNCM